tara:strand:+ start:1958 stop:2158 length:201 start_codon:yes stop_codon:yes gene_type:complete
MLFEGPCHLLLCLGRVVFMWVLFSYLLKIRKEKGYAFRCHMLGSFTDGMGEMQGLKRVAAIGIVIT